MILGTRRFPWWAVAGLMLIGSAVAAEGPGSSTVPAANNPAKAGVGKQPAIKKPGSPVTPVVMSSVRFEQLSTKAQFNALADDTLLEVGGRKIRKADFIADFKRRTASEQVAVANRPDGLPALRARLAAEEEAAIAASAAEVRRRLAESKARGGVR